MKTMVGKIIWLNVLALVLLPVAWANGGQGYGQGQQTPPKPAPPAQPGQTGAQPAAPAPPPVNAEEEAAYKAFFEFRGEPSRKVQLGDEFLKKFPESRYRTGVYSGMASAYAALGEQEKIVAAGEKALELSPDEVNVLALLALVLPRTVNPGSLDTDQKLEKAEKYSKQAITLLATMQKPAGLTDEDFAKAKNDRLSMCHSGLGIGYFHRQKYADSAAELEQATQLVSPPDPVDLYVLGLAYMNTKRFADAANALGRCVDGTGPGPFQDRCKQGAEQAKKQAATQLAPPKP